MRKSKKIVSILCMFLCLAIVSAIPCLASGSWTSSVTLSVPGYDQSATTMLQGIKSTKASDDATCSFYTYSCEASSKPDGRLINSNSESRSNWARNLDTETYTYATTTASKGYYYYAEISSDLTQLGAKNIRFKFSADYLTS